MHTLKVFWRPDDYPEWLAWRTFTQGLTQIGQSGAIDTGGIPIAKAGFVPRKSLQKPPDICDPVTSRNLRRGYKFQVRMEGTGHVVIDRMRLHAQQLIESSLASG